MKFKIRRPKKINILMIILKIIMMQLTAVYSLTMVCCAGAGLIYNGDSYGAEISAMGAAFILSGILMTTGAILCLFRKMIPNCISLFLSAGGLTICLIMLYKLCIHADNAGWHDNITMLPASDMYMRRVLPTVIPAAIAVTTAIIQILSLRNQYKDSKPNKSILD